MEFCERASAAGFLLPGTCCRVQLYSEMFSNGARINLLRKGVDEWQVVRLDGKRRPFEKVSEVTDCGMHCEKFSIEDGILGFCRGELSAEECEQLPGTMEDLFKDRVRGDVAGIGGEHEGKTRHRKLGICCGEKGLFRGFEGGFLGGAPEEHLGFTGEGGVDRSHRGSNVRKETVIIIHHLYELL